MKAFRRKLCHPIFRDVEDLDTLAERVVEVWRLLHKQQAPQGLTLAKAGSSVLWVVHADAPRKIGGWVSMDLEAVSAPNSIVWIGYDEDQRNYAVLTAAASDEGPSVVVEHVQSLVGTCYKSNEVM